MYHLNVLSPKVPTLDSVIEQMKKFSFNFKIYMNDWRDKNFTTLEIDSSYAACYIILN